MAENSRTFSPERHRMAIVKVIELVQEHYIDVQSMEIAGVNKSVVIVF